jgi:hypothetical protein
MRTSGNVVVLAALAGCVVSGPTTVPEPAVLGIEFLPAVSRSFPPKSDSYEMRLFALDEEPTSEYEVIGLIELDLEQTTRDTTDTGIGLIKDLARRRGADAIMDLFLSASEITHRTQRTCILLERYDCSLNHYVVKYEVKAIVYKKER